MNQRCKPTRKPDISPPGKKAPRLATEARINRQKLDSWVRFYHEGTQTPSRLCKLSSALPIETWRWLRWIATKRGKF
jgi:hypothetical protein